MTVPQATASAATPFHATPSLHARSTAHLRRLVARFADSPVPFALQLPDGRSFAFGAGSAVFRVVIRHSRALRALATLDEGIIAETYLSGGFDIEGEMIRMFALRKRLTDKHLLRYLWRFLQPMLLGQASANARAIQSHYDLDPEFYLAFFGAGRCYTQGIFEHDEESLEIATERKFDFCLDACQLKPGSHVLEVGPGWGAFAEYAARRGIHISAVTNSRTSEDYMKALGQRLGFSWTIHNDDILCFDAGERYDAIVLMGIIEHLPDYPAVLGRFQRLLKPGGRVYLDASAYRVKYDESSFIYRYIYPANHTFFVLHDFLAALAKTPLKLKGVYDDQWNYYLTFARWARNFEANREAVVARFGEFNWRRFHLYLWGSAHCFLDDGLQCYRVVLEAPAADAA